jgi:dTDP-4-dehydrorhamnose 3,5-epimerase-like enzyme
MTNISKIKIINIKQVNARGLINIAEKKKHINFNIKRIYYLHNLKVKQRRGFHAHKNLEQLFICIQGSFRFIFFDGYKKKEIFLKESTKAIYVPKLIWREFFSLKKKSILLVICNDVYNKKDYIFNKEVLKKG